MFGTIIQGIAELFWEFLDLREWHLRWKAKREGKKQPFPFFTILLSIFIVLAFLLIIIWVWIHWPLVGIPDAQVHEMDSIVNSLNAYKDYHGSYPKDMDSFIQGIPIRRGWLSDCWGSEYIYEIFNNGQNFELRSSGRDKKIGTEDDIIRTSK